MSEKTDPDTIYLECNVAASATPAPVTVKYKDGTVKTFDVLDPTSIGNFEDIESATKVGCSATSIDLGFIDEDDIK